MIHIDTFGSIRAKERRERNRGDFVELGQTHRLSMYNTKKKKKMKEICQKAELRKERKRNITSSPNIEPGGGGPW